MFQKAIVMLTVVLGFSVAHADKGYVFRGYVDEDIAEDIVDAVDELNDEAKKYGVSHYVMHDLNFLLNTSERLEDCLDDSRNCTELGTAVLDEWEYLKDPLDYAVKYVSGNLRDEVGDVYNKMRTLQNHSGYHNPNKNALHFSHRHGNDPGGNGGGRPGDRPVTRQYILSSDCRLDNRNYCEVTVSWDTGFRNQSAIVSVVVDGKESVVACENPGQTTVNWIAPGKAYTFNMYKSSQCNLRYAQRTGGFLKSVVVQGAQPRVEPRVEPPRRNQPRPDNGRGNSTGRRDSDHADNNSRGSRSGRRPRPNR